MTVFEAWDLYWAGSDRRLYERVAAEARAKGNTEHLGAAERLLSEPRVGRQGSGGRPAGSVVPLEALAAGAEVVRRLVGWRYVGVLAAREAGASWAEVADAVGVSRREVYRAYVRSVRTQEQVHEEHGWDFDAARFRAAACLGVLVPPEETGGGLCTG